VIDVEFRLVKSQPAAGAAATAIKWAADFDPQG
jgi:hypothetical protein